MALSIPAVKRVIPQSMWTYPRGEVDARSWDAAIDVIEQSILEIATPPAELSEDQIRILRAIVSKCESLRAKEYLEGVRTNHDLAKKYAISPRTVTNWRKKGCPFDKGQWQVLDWMFARPYLPSRAKEKFARQFWRRLRSAARCWRDVCRIINVPLADSFREILDG